MKTVLERITKAEQDRRKQFQKIVKDEIKKELGIDIVLPRVSISRFLGVKPVIINITIQMPTRGRKKPRIYQL